MSDDPYVYPDTDVLRNMRDIRDGDELEGFEAHLTFLRGLRLASDLIAGEYDLAHLQASPLTLRRALRVGRRAGDRRAGQD